MKNLGQRNEGGTISPLSFVLAGILFFSLPLAGCAKTGEGSYHTSVLTILAGIKTGKFIINEDSEDSEAPETTSGNGKVKNYGLDKTFFYGVSGTSKEPVLFFSIEGVEDNSIIVKIENDTNKSRKAYIENYFYPVQKTACTAYSEDYDGVPLDDTNNYGRVEVTVPKKKTVTVKVPIPNIPGPLSYCGAPYDS